MIHSSQTSLQIFPAGNGGKHPKSHGKLATFSEARCEYDRDHGYQSSHLEDQGPSEPTQIPPPAGALPEITDIRQRHINKENNNVADSLVHQKTETVDHDIRMHLARIWRLPASLRHALPQSPTMWSPDLSRRRQPALQNPYDRFARDAMDSFSC